MYNPFSLEGKTVLITGASSGIGQATAIECSRMGAKVVITARNQEKLQETLDLLQGDGHQMIVADLTKEDDIKKIAEESPKLDGLVNNAGVSVLKPVAYYTYDDINKVFASNTFAPMMLDRWLLKKKKLNFGASIVFTSSISTMNAVFGNGIYGASKGALTVYMRYLANELATKKIRVNAIHPGMIDTKFIHGGSVSEADLEADMKRYPLGRYGKPEEIAWQVIFFLSNASSWTTGTSVVVDGGVLLN